jgi:hypothetical protein
MPTRFVSNGALRDMLSYANAEERLALTQVLVPDSKSAYSSEALQEQVCIAGGHGLFNWVRGHGTGYIDIVDDVAEALEIGGIPTYSGTIKHRGFSLREIDEIDSIRINNRDINVCRAYGVEYVELAEKAILLKLLQTTYERLTPEERRRFDDKVREVAKQFGKDDPTGKLAGGAGLLVIGNLGGFATYTLMSTALSTISLGTLGFGAYTAASSALSVILGPVGWVALGAAGAYALGKPELKKTIPLVSTIAMIRQRINCSVS